MSKENFREKQNELFREYANIHDDLMKVMGRLTDILRVYNLVNCESCDGNGHDSLFGDPCEKCKGTGVVKGD